MDKSAAGTYKCKAENNLGTATEVFNVAIQGTLKELKKVYNERAYICCIDIKCINVSEYKNRIE